MGREVQRELEIRELLRYLEFTRVLELEFVNPLLSKIAAGEYADLFSFEQRIDALKIYTDEGYHAYFSVDLMDQVATTTGIRGTHGSPRFRTRFAEILASESDLGSVDILRLLAVSTHEQLITGSLRRANDPSLVAGVRELLLDHVRDEAVHAIYFAQVFRRAWQQLAPEEAQALGPVLADVIACFLDPDLEAVSSDLHIVGLCSTDAKSVLDDTYTSQGIGEARRHGASQVLLLFESCGVLNDQRAARRFRQLGLL